MNITNPFNITATASLENGGTVELEGATDITTFESGGHTYAAVTAYGDSNVQILNITNPSTSPPQTASKMAVAWSLRVQPESLHSSQTATPTPQSQHILITASRY